MENNFDMTQFFQTLVNTMTGLINTLPAADFDKYICSDTMMHMALTFTSSNPPEGLDTSLPETLPDDIKRTLDELVSKFNTLTFEQWKSDDLLSEDQKKNLSNIRQPDILTSNQDLVIHKVLYIAYDNKVLKCYYYFPNDQSQYTKSIFYSLKTL